MKFEEYWNSLAISPTDDEEIIRHCQHAAKMAWDAASINAYEAAEVACKKAIETVQAHENKACAALCEEKSNKCAASAELTDDHDDAISLKALAWQFKVMACEIQRRMK